MNLLHLCFDGHAIRFTIPVFEHFYPNQNVWFISEGKKNTKRIVNTNAENVRWIKPWENKKYLEEILSLDQRERFDAIVLHGLTGHYLEILKIIPEVKSRKVYWIFWGFELYRVLGYSGKMRLVDDESICNPMSYIQPTRYASFLWMTLKRRKSAESVFLEFLPYINYFCFWLYEDYLLLQKHYPSPIKFKAFQYGASWKGDDVDYCQPGQYFLKNTYSILVNHQASTTGNHSTILKKLHSLKGIDAYHITAPLSYGSRITRKYVNWLGRHYFKDNFHSLVEFMPLENYYNIIGGAAIAIFGQLRQEAAGNIDFLLANGAKVFLRENNTLYQHYKKLGFIIFSFENDLKSIDDLQELSIEEKMHNLKVYKQNIVFYENFMPTFFTDN